MKRFFLIFIVVLFLLLEVGFFANIEIIGIVPNVFLMLLIALSFIIQEEELLYLTFCGALFLDLFSSSYFGVFTLIILTIIFLVLLASYFVFSTVNFFLLMLLAAIATFVFDITSIFALMVSGFNIDIVFYLKNFLVLKVIINSIIVLILYFSISSIWDNISKYERKVKLFR